MTGSLIVLRLEGKTKEVVMGEDDRIGFAAAMLDELLVRIDKTGSGFAASARNVCFTIRSSKE